MSDEKNKIDEMTEAELEDIEIIIQTNDQTGGSLTKVQNGLLALDRAVKKTQKRLKRAFSNAYQSRYGRWKSG